MNVSIAVNADGLRADLKTIREDQLPFALKTAINTTALQFQRVQIAHDRSVFTVRKPWSDQSVKITHFATKTEPWATIGIHPPGGDERADILGKFEDQTAKQPFKAGGSLAIPVDAKRNKFDIVTNRQRPKSFAFVQEQTNSKSGVRIYRGRSGAFMVQMPDGRGWILKRTGGGSRGSLFDGTQVLYVLTKNAVHITPDLDFASNAIAVVEGGWHINMELAYNDALSKAR